MSSMLSLTSCCKALFDVRFVSARESTDDGVLEWKGGKSAAPQDEVRVRFVLLRARLYSFDWV
jgi:hypothetical protein